MTFNNHPANRQSQSYAMRLCREKRIKDAAQLFRVNSRPRIFHRDDNCIAIVKPVLTRNTRPRSVVLSIASIAF